MSVLCQRHRKWRSNRFLYSNYVDSSRNGGVQILRSPARDFDPNGYGTAARGETPRKVVKSSTPATFTQQQKLGAALGIPAATTSSHPHPGMTPRGHHHQNGHHQLHHAPPHRGRGQAGPASGADNAFQALFANAKRGAPGGGFKTVPHGSGVGVPPPAALTSNDGERMHRGRGRGRGRGGAHSTAPTTV